MTKSASSLLAHNFDVIKKLSITIAAEVLSACSCPEAMRDRCYKRCVTDCASVTHRHQLSSKAVAMGPRFHSYKRNKLVRSKVKTHAQRMHYEAVIQVAQIQDEDLLYLNFSNAAMGAHSAAWSPWNCACALQACS